jgi:hypothetical protein
MFSPTVTVIDLHTRRTYYYCYFFYFYIDYESVLWKDLDYIPPSSRLYQNVITFLQGDKS